MTLRRSTARNWHTSGLVSVQRTEGPPQQMSQAESAARPAPLAGVLIADFSRVLAGPYCTMLLADLGADVIKVESPQGDDTRRWVPPVTDDGVSTYYLAINRNKRSVALDLTDRADLAAARELARRADVLVENFKPGGLAKFGLDYASVSRREPRHRLCLDQRIRRRRREGPARLRPHGAGDIRADEPDRGSRRTAVPGRHLGLRRHRRTAHGDRHPGRARSAGRTGLGQHVEASLMASALSAMVNQTSAYAAGGVTPFRMGNSHPSLFPYEPLPTASGDLIITAGNDGQFRKLCQVLGAEHLADDARFARTDGRTAQPRSAPAAADRPAGQPPGRRMVQRTDRGRRAVRAYQHRRPRALRSPSRSAWHRLSWPAAETPRSRTIRHPLTFSESAPRYELPAAAT